MPCFAMKLNPRVGPNQTVQTNCAELLVLDFRFLVYMHLRNCAPVEFSCFRGEILSFSGITW